MQLWGGADGTMNIETGIFTAITSGYYTITFSARADVFPDEYSFMYIFHNGAKVTESQWETFLGGASFSYMADQGSRTVVGRQPETLLLFTFGLSMTK